MSSRLKVKNHKILENEKVDVDDAHVKFLYSSDTLEEKKHERKNSVQKIGLLCVSPGLATERMDNTMLSTIKISKNIEKNQKETILTELTKNTTNEQDNNFVSENNDKTSPHVSQHVATTLLNITGNKDTGLKSQSKVSLARKNIPSPLNLSSKTTNPESGRKISLTSTSTYKHQLQSAPAHITRHTIKKKPRVQYLGTSNSIAMARQARSAFQFQQYSARMRTPYMPYYPNFPMEPFMSPYPPMYRPMRSSIPGNPSYAPYPFPRTAVPYSSEAQFYKENSTDIRARNSVILKDNNSSKREFFSVSTGPDGETSSQNFHSTMEHQNSSSRDSNGMNSSEDGENDEDTHLALDADDADDISPTSISSAVSSPVQGEIRLTKHIFGFEFPTATSKSDKNLFMSICDKVWDESQELTKKESQ